MSAEDEVVPPPSSTGGGEDQGSTAIVPAASRGIPKGSIVGRLPEILLEGGSESSHSQLTWKLISRFASSLEEDKEALRADVSEEKGATERWRNLAEQRNAELIDLRARWSSVSRLGTVQALLYTVGGVLAGPFLVAALERRFEPVALLVALLGAASILGAYGLGRIGPGKRGA